MSTSATIPVFDPQGTLRDIPEDQLQAAVKAGGTPAVKFQAPDNSIRFVPASKTQDAVRAGGKLLPFEQQDVKHPGFWGSVWNDIKSIPSSLAAPDPLADPRVSDAEKSRIVVEQQADAAAQNAMRAREHGAGYSWTASAGEMLGVPVGGMERSAQEGDVAGVMGHAATVPIVMAATEGAIRGAPVVAEAARNVPLSKVTAPVRAAVRGANVALAKAPGTVGTTIGTAAGAAGGAMTGIPYMTEVGAGLGGNVGSLIGKELLPRVRIPGEGFGLPSRVEGGPAVAPQYQAAGSTPVGATPSAAGSMVASVAPQTPAVTPSGAGLPRTLSGESALGTVLSRLDNQSLLKIARSRGINVAQESVLKAGSANGRLIQKIANDFSPDELQEFRDRYLESSRFQHQFSAKMTPESWSTVVLQHFFPDIKIPQTVLSRTRTAMAATDSPAQGAIPSRRR